MCIIRIQWLPITYCRVFFNRNKRKYTCFACHRCMTNKVSIVLFILNFIYLWIYNINFLFIKRVTIYTKSFTYIKARRWVLPLNTECLQNPAESGERSVLTLVSLCLPYCVRDTAWSWFNLIRLRLSIRQANVTTALLQYRITKPVCFAWHRFQNYKIFFKLFLFNKMKVCFVLCKIYFLLFRSLFEVGFLLLKINFYNTLSLQR